MSQASEDQPFSLARRPQDPRLDRRRSSTSPDDRADAKRPEVFMASAGLAQTRRPGPENRKPQALRVGWAMGVQARVILTNAALVRCRGGRRSGAPYTKNVDRTNPASAPHFVGFSWRYPESAGSSSGSSAVRGCPLGFLHRHACVGRHLGAAGSNAKRSGSLPAQG